MLPHLLPVLQAFQHRQVIGPGVFGTESGHVVPAGLLFCQLPASGSSGLRPGGRGCGIRYRRSKLLLHGDSLRMRVPKARKSFKRVYREKKERHKEQKHLNTSTRRHLRPQQLNLAALAAVALTGWRMYRRYYDKGVVHEY